MRVFTLFVYITKVLVRCVFAKRYDFGCNFWDREGRTKTGYTQKCTV